MLYWSIVGKTIWVTDREYPILRQAKGNFEAISGVKMSWGGFFTLVSLGALAGSAVTGAKFRCPNCEAETIMTLECPELVELGEEPSAPSPSASLVPPSPQRRSPHQASRQTVRSPGGTASV